MKNIYSLIAIIVNKFLTIIGLSFIFLGLDRILHAYVALPKPILNSMYPIMLGTSIMVLATKMLQEILKD